MKGGWWLVDAAALVGLFGLALWVRDYALLSCSWTAGIVARIAFFADPQIEGDYKILRNGWLGKTEVLLNDVFHRAVASGIARLYPTHAVTLGDLFSNEWLSKSEFQTRKERLRWSMAPIFTKVPTLNVTGNHDIGYGVALRPSYISMFEEAFGPANSLMHAGGHILCNLNSQTLDSTMQALKEDTWNQVYQCVEEKERTGMPLLLVTHIPLYDGSQPTRPGCDDYLVNRAYSGEIRDQTHLTPETSKKLVQELKPALIFVGHDHGGCFGTVSGVKQYTVRSMMGDFEGNAQLLAIGKDASGKWQYAVSACSLGIKMSHIVCIVAVLGGWLGARLVFVTLRWLVVTARSVFTRRPTKLE